MNMLQVERDFIQSQHAELAKEYPNKFLAIQGTEVLAAEDDFDDAADRGSELAAGDFLVRHVDHPDDPVINIPLDSEIEEAILEGGGNIHVPRRTASPEAPGSSG